MGSSVYRQHTIILVVETPKREPPFFGNPHTTLQGRCTIIITWKLLCSSFLVLTCFLNGACHELPKKELHRSLQLAHQKPKHWNMTVPQAQSLECKDSQHASFQAHIPACWSSLHARPDLDISSKPALHHQARPL